MGPFINLLATTYGLPEKSVVLVGRAMREAGWLTSGARGVNAPEMTAVDMARLSIALLTGEPPSKVVSEFEFIRELQTNEAYPDDGFVSQSDLPEAHNFEDAVIALAAASQNPGRIARYGSAFSEHIFINPAFSVSVDMSRRTAVINAQDLSAEYLDLAGEGELELLWADRSMTLGRFERINELESRSISSEISSHVVGGRGMRVVRTITHTEFERIAESMRREAEDVTFVIDDFPEAPEGSEP